ncbi:hypothetical protein LSAT2_023827 [Lamellibrachia satsuma]|nr:hypothetical protein LSAT2_023827 [Lamellibrachia satsuma]
MIRFSRLRVACRRPLHPGEDISPAVLHQAGGSTAPGRRQYCPREAAVLPQEGGSTAPGRRQYCPREAAVLPQAGGIPQHIVERWHRIPRPGDSIKSLDGSAPKNISHVCCETSEYKCCIFLPEREPDDENVRIRTTAIVFAKLVEALPRRFVMSVLAVVFAVHFGLFVFNNTKPTTMSNYVLSVAAMSRHGVASAQSILELVVAATQMYTVGKDDEWEDLTNDPYGRDVRVRRLIGRLQKLRKKNEALVVREQRQRSIMHKTAMSVVDKKSKYQSLQKLLKFEYIQLQIFENILMEELTDVGPDQVRQFEKRQSAACGE